MEISVEDLGWQMGDLDISSSCSGFSSDEDTLQTVSPSNAIAIICDNNGGQVLQEDNAVVNQAGQFLCTMQNSLTSNVIPMINEGLLIQGDIRKIVLQVVAMATRKRQFFVQLSDGMYLQEALIAPHKYCLTYSGELQKGSLIEFSLFICQNFENRKILCISDLKVAVIICDPIGKPKPYVPKSGAGYFSAFPLQVEVDSGYIGKECGLRGGWPLNIVAKGIVQDVDPVTIFGNRRLGKGNFKVYVKSIIYGSTELPFPHDQQSSRTLGQIRQGSVIWPKSLLVPLTQ
ncbi:hypothetical protein IFM89_032374 [Coptis chinensis]|uniref:Uncharacterized protein n=1 Tax=Coptis chinensis TaxID=261450 RepID=A0A835HZU9_9MAGN|nr:hypothetical protein IFM89_032374 [Coptis chinensis]